MSGKQPPRRMIACPDQPGSHAVAYRFTPGFGAVPIVDSGSPGEENVGMAPPRECGHVAGGGSLKRLVDGRSV